MNNSTTKPTESVDLGKNGIIALANSSGIDTDTDGDIWGSTNGAIFKFADALIALARRAPAQQDADAREAFEAWHRSKFATKHSTGQPTRDMHNGVYVENYGPKDQQQMWEVWQAARATQPVGQPDFHFQQSAPNSAPTAVSGQGETAPAANAAGLKPMYGPDNPPRLRKPGESVQDYRIAMGWDQPKSEPISAGHQYDYLAELKLDESQIAVVRDAKRAMIDRLISSALPYGKCGVISYHLEQMLAALEGRPAAEKAGGQPNAQALAYQLHQHAFAELGYTEDEFLAADDYGFFLNIAKGALAMLRPAAADAGVLMPLANGLPSPDDHLRVLVYTDGVDFNGDQYFDISTEDLWEPDPDMRTEVADAATHWMPLPRPGKVGRAAAVGAGGQQP